MIGDNGFNICAGKLTCYKYNSRLRTACLGWRLILCPGVDESHGGFLLAWPQLSELEKYECKT